MSVAPSEKFTLQWHADARVLEICLFGTWEAADVMPYYAAMDAYARANVTLDGFHILTNLLSYPAQKQDVIATHMTILEQVQKDSPVQREAWVAAGNVLLLQARRSARAGDQVIATFATRDEAWAYLAAPVTA